VKLSYLIRGLPGHPLHPPLTDVTVGLYTGATAFAVLSAAGISEENLATAWWLALIAGLIATGPTALAGLANWLGGAIVFTHGMRVLNLVDEPAGRAITPGHPEKERAEG
jgi:hypothetical protein